MREWGILKDMPHFFIYSLGLMAYWYKIEKFLIYPNFLMK